MDTKRLSVKDATPFDGPYRRPWLDHPAVRFAAAIALVAACYGLVVLCLPAPL